MTEKQKSRKRLGKVAVALMALGSLLGIGAVPAAAAPWDQDNPTWQIDVAVTDSSCEPDYSEAIWAPNQSISALNTNVDMFFPTSVDFEVYLNFSSGSDRNVCGGDDKPPAGDVTASFFSIDPALQVDRLDCSETCSAATLMTGSFSTITGSLSVVDGTADGTYSAVLQVVWTPES